MDSTHTHSYWPVASFRTRSLSRFTFVLIHFCFRHPKVSSFFRVSQVQQSWEIKIFLFLSVHTKAFMVGVSLVLRLAGWAKTLQPGELERWQRAIGRTWRGFLAAMTGLTLYGELKRKKLASTSSAIHLSRSSNGWTGGGDTAVRLDWNGLLLSFFLCFTEY